MAMAAIRFATVAFLSKQLNNGCIAAALTRIGYDMVVLKALCAATALANTPIPCEDDLFSRRRDMPALGMTK
jgi:hypothetical protein